MSEFGSDNRSGDVILEGLSGVVQMVCECVLVLDGSVFCEFGQRFTDKPPLKLRTGQERYVKGSKKAAGSGLSSSKRCGICVAHDCNK